MPEVDPTASRRPSGTGRLGPVPGSRLLVVGGCGGIGRALVRAALEIDLKVAVFDLAEAAVEEELPERVILHQLDATREGPLRRALEELGGQWQGLDCLVNLAGAITESAPVGDSDPVEWSRTLDSSLRTTYLTCRAALPWLRRGSSPSVVNMSSGMAYVGRTGYSAYAAAKAAILALTRTLATEKAPWLRVNAVAPGHARRGGRADPLPCRGVGPLHHRTGPAHQRWRPDGLSDSEAGSAQGALESPRGAGGDRSPSLLFRIQPQCRRRGACPDSSPALLWSPRLPRSHRSSLRTST